MEDILQKVSKIMKETGGYENIIIDIWGKLEYEKVRSPNIGDVVVDAGAGIGTFTVKAALQVGDSGFVYAFEPEPRNFKYLALNTEKFGNVKISRKALWSSEGEKTLYLHSCNVGGHSLYSLPKHLTPVDKPKLIVQATRLDKVVKGRVDFLKIDVERSELEVLKGAKRILEDYHPFIAVELHGEQFLRDVMSFLDNYGYKRNIGYTSPFKVHTFEHRVETIINTLEKLCDEYQ